MMGRLTDNHFHLDFVEDPARFSAAADAAGISMLAVSCTPSGYRLVRDATGAAPNVRAAVGAHPWWVADGRLGSTDIDEVVTLVGETDYVGEIGLDFSPKHVPQGSEELQIAAFERICMAAAREDGKVLSIHSVRAAGTVLDVLERTGALDGCRCVFHWFSGSSDEIWRAIRGGCRFSVNEMMLSTGRGREYAKLIPRDRLLLETDQPAGQRVPWDVERVTGSLVETLMRLERVLGRDVADEVQANAETLLDR